MYGRNVVGDRDAYGGIINYSHAYKNQEVNPYRYNREFVEYEDMHKTLKILEKSKEMYEMAGNLPYSSGDIEERVRKVFPQDREKLDSLGEAINVTKEDIMDKEKGSTIKSYLNWENANVEKIKKSSEDSVDLFLLGMGSMALSVGGYGIATAINSRKKQLDLRNVDKV